MTPEHWERLRDVFHAVLDLPREDRAAFIASPAVAESLRGELHSLLAMHETEPAEFEQAVADFKATLNEQSQSYHIGERVLGRFLIVRCVGVGGMGEVYEAQDAETGRIALKTIRLGFSENTQMLGRFRQEVNVARKVAGPNICRIHELFPDPAKRTYFLTMEFLEGETLADHIEEHGALPIKEATRVAHQLCAGLCVIHEAGIVHRDFKTRNVILAERNGLPQAVITDFGLAREGRADQVSDDSGLTQPGMVMGTPEYMAPEQFEGRPAAATADLFALGVVLYKVVTGKSPFPASSALGAAIQRAKRPPAASSLRAGLPKRWDAVISRCLEHEPERRFQSAAEVSAALRGGSLHFPVPLLASVVRGMRNWIAVVLAMALVCAVGWFVLKEQRHTPPKAAQEWYAKGLEALREGTYFDASKKLSYAVDLDSDFALAHARLAEAWNELDFSARASEEMLRAMSPKNAAQPTRLERLYLEAIHATVTHDFAGAVERYREALQQAGANERADAEVDLGRALERAGSINEAIHAYELAGRTESPAAYVRVGILYGRQRKIAESEKAFGNAEVLYIRSSHTEGLAEIDYQRGYLANNQGRPAAAREALLRSYENGRAVRSAQLQARALSQLSITESITGNRERAKEYASGAVRIAREDGNDYWAADAQARLGTAYMVERDFEKAEEKFEEVRRAGKVGQHPRLVALAELNLAGLRNQQKRPAEVVPLAEGALSYYRQQNFPAEALSALVLIGRAERDLGDFAGATKIALEQLEAAGKKGDASGIVQAEEFAGSIAAILQDYPAALHHFETALNRARQAGLRDVPAETLKCADQQWRLGNYAQAEKLLGDIPEGSLANQVATAKWIRVQMLLSKGQARESRELAKKTLREKEVEKMAVFRSLQFALAKAQIRTGEAARAKPVMERARLEDAEKKDPQAVAEDDLALSEAYLAIGGIDAVRTSAESALAWFAAHGERESELASLSVLAAIGRKVGDTESTGMFNRKILDICETLKNNWGSISASGFLSRPDIQGLQRTASGSR